jgi:hypothetical protein
MRQTGFRNSQALGFLNRCPQLVHFMFTRAAGPACVNGWVFTDPHTGHGGRGGAWRESPDETPERSVIARAYVTRGRGSRAAGDATHDASQD